MLMDQGLDHTFTPSEVSTLADGTDLTTTEVNAAIAQWDTSQVAKNRRKMLLKLLALL